jgi:response regulator RpfG family c-di-GMP phosphodiesterase
MPTLVGDCAIGKWPFRNLRQTGVDPKLFKQRVFASNTSCTDDPSSVANRPTGMRVLVVDDNASNVRLVSRIDDCSVVGFTDPVKALAAVGDTPIDLALVDYMMPEIDGLEFIGKLRGMPGSEDIPIVKVTAAGSVRYAALDAGATDFLTKPIDPVEAKSRIRNMLRLRDSQNRLRDQVTWLAREVKKATGALAAREEEIIFRLSRAAEYRDNDTGDHIVRVAKYCRLIGEALSLDEKCC